MALHARLILAALLLLASWLVRAAEAEAGTNTAPMAAADSSGSPEWRARTAVARQQGLGESAPDWLVNSETYAIGYTPELDALAEAKVAFITHCPVNADFFARCHAFGIRCFPYVTFYQGNASSAYEGVNLKEHPDFIEVDSKGELQRTRFWKSEDNKNSYTTCPNVAAYQDAMVAWVRRIMVLGADGVFVDNLASREPCWGPKFGKHQHICEDQNYAFAMLLKRVRALVKQYKPDGAVLGNSANPPSLPREYWAYLDADMLESYICTWVSKERWFDWQTHWNKAGQDLQPLVRAGKQIQALSYLGHTPYGVREDALFCYASARLGGFVWNGGLPISHPDVADLYRLRLGKPLTDEREEKGAHYRLFERGLVAVNPDRSATRQITLGSPAPTRRLLDLSGSVATGWSPYAPGGYRVDALTHRAGARSIVCEAFSVLDCGASETIEVNQARAEPLVLSGWSKAEAVSGGTNADYSLYIDAAHGDGTFLYGQTAQFRPGTHDWEQSSFTLRPEKPIRSLTLYCLLRGRTGRAWFDEVSLKTADGAELVRNGGFEEEQRQSVLVDAASCDGKVTIPAYSGRVYLYAPDNGDALATHGPRLTIVTSPGLGEVRFRVDGFDYWTHCGYWTTEYVLGPNFGKFDIVFDKPGAHTVEVVDVVPADMKTPAGYSSGQRLGEFMDPSNPTKPSADRKFRFREWQGRGASPRIQVNVEKDTTLTALFDVRGK
jgi:hypothetical protein